MHYITYARIPTEKAHGVQIMRMCEAFARLGCCVKLVLPNRESPLDGDPFQTYGIEKNFTIDRICTPNFVMLGQIGYHLSVAWFAVAARWHTRKTPADLVYTRDPLLGIIFRTHALELHDLPKRATWPIRWLWRRARRFIVKTTHIRARLIEHGISGDRILIAKNGVDFASFGYQGTRVDLRERLGLPQDRCIALYMGSFYTHEWKGVDVLLAASRLLPKEILTVLVGGSANDVRRISSEYPSDQVQAHPHIPNRDVAAWLHAADVLVLPNKSGCVASDLYTSPLKLFEYLAVGQPIVSSDLPSIREIVTEQEVTFVPPNSVEALADGIKKVLQADPGDTASMSARAKSKAKEYLWETQAKRILAFIRHD